MPPDPNEEKFLAEASRNYSFLDLRTFREKAKLLDEFLKKLNLTNHETIFLLQYTLDKVRGKTTIKALLNMLKDEKDKE